MIYLYNSCCLGYYCVFQFYSTIIRRDAISFFLPVTRVSDCAHPRNPVSVNRAIRQQLFNIFKRVLIFQELLDSMLTK